MTKFRGLDTDLGWQKREFKKVWAAIREANAAKRLVSSTVGAGGSLVMRGLLQVVGNVSMISEDGFELFRLGDMEFGRGLEIKRDDGTSALLFHKTFSNSTVQTLSFLDTHGKAILADSSLSAGLGRPYLEYPFQPVATTSGTTVQCGPFGLERTHASTTWTDLFAYDGKAQNPLIDLKFAAMCSDATTAGEIRVIDDSTGTPLPGYLTGSWVGSIPAGTTTMSVVDPTPGQVYVMTSREMGDPIQLAIQCRRTAGTGTITLALTSSIGSG